MKLNHDCVRKLLLHIEKNLDDFETIDLCDITLDGFSSNDIIYTAKKLTEADYINAKIFVDTCGEINATVYCITWEGHKFLDTIRDNQVWTNTKKILSKVSSASITFVSNIASQVLTNIINQQFDINNINITS